MSKNVQPAEPLRGNEEYRAIVAAADAKTMRCRGFKVLSTSPLTVAGCSAFPANGAVTERAYIEFPIELPDGSINVWDIKVHGWVDMSWVPVVPPQTVIYEKRDEVYDADGNKTETVRTLYHEGGRCQDEKPSGADSGMRTLIANPRWTWANNDTEHRYAVVQQDLSLGVVFDDCDHEARVAVLSSRVPQTLEALHSYPGNGLPCYWSETKPGPKGARTIWVRLTGHRVEALAVFSVSVKVRGIFSDGVTVAAHTRKPRAARKGKKPAAPVQVAPAEQPANVAGKSITLSEVTAEQSSASAAQSVAQCGA